MNRSAFSILPVAVLLGLLVSPAAQAETGHCLFKQYAPKLRIWYPACQMPATSKAECETLISANKAQVEFAEGACSARNVVGVCEIRGKQMYFYQGRSSDLRRGCEINLHGVWRADLVPKG